MREKLSLCADWRLHIGDLPIPSTPARKGPAYQQGKSESALWGPASRFYDDNSDSYAEDRELQTILWETVSLPHDYTIRQTPKECYNNARGFFKEEAAWYRKKFSLSEEDKSKRLLLHFEGISHHSTVWVNGQPMAENFAPHLPVIIDITDIARFDEPNVVVVYIDGKNREGWWYEGGGIYRKVWLEKRSLVAIDTFGVYVHPEKTAEGFWNVHTDLTLHNHTTALATVRAEITVSDPQGNPLSFGYCDGSVGAFSESTLSCTVALTEAELWDIDAPKLYTLQAKLLQEETVIDACDTPFGFREVEFTPDRGLLLNGKPLPLRGVCCHEDYGLCGRAVPESIKRYRLDLLKEMGANAYRGAHYPHSEGTLDHLDRIGMVVMAETRTFLSSEQGLDELRRMILRDRNHPCIILWSVGNEEPLTLHEIGAKMATHMVAVAHQLDSRPVTCVLSHNPPKSTLLDVVDVISINYGIFEGHHDTIHQSHPHKAILAGETCATGSGRGWYEDTDPSYKYLNAYDKDTNNWFRGREKTFRYLAERPWHCGFFQWAGIEHRGEAIWPRLCSQSGALDLYLIKKDAFYQNKSHFTKAPMIHILPHWNFQGREGEPIKVVTYTNCPQTELFLNGVSQGKQIPDPHGHGEWIVPYQGGELRAVGIRKNKVIAEEIIKTTGAPVALRLTQQTKPRTEEDDCAVFHCECVDSQGSVIPTGEAEVEFFVTGAGKILGTGSDNTDPIPPACQKRRMRAGVIAIAVAVTGSEPIRLFATSPGLSGTSVTF